ncbi:MAG TPA: HYExAFE family protein [Pirellulaceae bacterium]|nr:HYExAFE family protein [Pirellulaceae bacterium]
MAKRDNHYEQAFAAFLRWRGIPYVAVDETRRSLAGERSLKNLDFIVSPHQQARTWLVDIKGRRFPTGHSQYWRNWCTEEELASLSGWEALFGERFTALLVFAYEVVGDLAPLPASQLFEHGGAIYGFVGVRLDHYVSWSRPLSRRWRTVTVSIPKFRALAKPVDAFLEGDGPPPLLAGLTAQALLAPVP